MTSNRILLTCSLLLTASIAAQTKLDRSAAAAQMLVLTDQARQAIAREDKLDAIQRVGGALDLASKAQGTIPIYAEVEQLSILGPITAEKRRQSPAADRPSPGQLTPALQEAREFTTISVDMGMARTRLNAAKTALGAGSLQEADKALAALQNAVVLVNIESDMPLLKARQSLYSAKIMAQQNRLGDALIPLRTASEALAEYVKTPTGRHGEDALKLRQEIDSSIGTLGSDTKAAAVKIDSWWNQTVDWFSRDQP